MAVPTDTNADEAPLQRADSLYVSLPHRLNLEPELLRRGTTSSRASSKDLETSSTGASADSGGSRLQHGTSTVSSSDFMTTSSMEAAGPDLQSDVVLRVEVQDVYSACSSACLAAPLMR